MNTASYRVFTRSSKRPANANVFKIHVNCWTFVGSCKHPIKARVYMNSELLIPRLHDQAIIEQTSSQLVEPASSFKRGIT